MGVMVEPGYVVEPRFVDAGSASVLLVAKRMYKGQIVVLREAMLPAAEARQKLREIAAFPGQVTGREKDGEGELWIETEEDGTLIDDPVCFAPEAAHATLVRTGIPYDEATEMLSDAYARSYLSALYAALTSWSPRDDQDIVC